MIDASMTEQDEGKITQLQKKFSSMETKTSQSLHITFMHRNKFDK